MLASAAHPGLSGCLPGNRQAIAARHHGRVDPIRFGRYVRAVRQRLALRQRDLAARVRVSASCVSRIERGRLREVSWAAIDDVCIALEISLDLRPIWRGFEGHRLLDADHAVIVNDLAAVLRSLGWEVVVEYTFNHYGDRGSVDILAWHSATRSLLVIEVKTRIVDVQELLSSIDRKVRVVPQLVRTERALQTSAAFWSFADRARFGSRSRVTRPSLRPRCRTRRGRHGAGFGRQSALWQASCLLRILAWRH
jgi:transcriptional regulator with XRE-family HTH domain